jgi:tetratricopeptide (TPR) repeat protein/ferredoxin
MLAHVAHWLTRGETLTPVEPSESMELFKSGTINAGVVFFGLAITSTLIFGRFFCGWGCHFVAYQDLAGWLLGKVGIRPQPVRSRVLLFVPFGLAFYMFAWPMVYRWWLALASDGQTPWWPATTAHWTTRTFWQTFPGWGFGLATVLVAGFAIVYFLGAKGFCAYACPYGAFFGLADNAAPLRVRVRPGACDHTGVCTSVCTSNVSVAAEVARYGMVVSSACMKCGDCVYSCPKDALHFGFGRPALGKKPTGQRPPIEPAGALPWTEELILVTVFLVSLLAWRGLYGGFPLLMTAGMSAIFAGVVLLATRLLRRADVALAGRPLRAGGRITPRGWAVAAGSVLIVVATLHAAAVTLCQKAGDHYFDRTGVADAALLPGFDPQRDLTDGQRADRDRAARWLSACARVSLWPTARLQFQRSWLELLAGDFAESETLARDALARQAGWSYLHHHLGRVLKVQGRLDEAIVCWRRARELGELRMAESELSAALIATGRLVEAQTHIDAILRQSPDDASALYYRGVLATQAGDADGAVAFLRRAIAADASRPEAHYQLGYVLVASGNPRAAIPSLEQAIALAPGMAIAHHNLAVARFMLGDLDAALTSARRAAELAPRDEQTRQFLQMLESHTPAP